MSFKYSVIIPHYNCEDGLERLLKSIPNKDFIEPRFNHQVQLIKLGLEGKLR